MQYSNRSHKIGEYSNPSSILTVKEMISELVSTSWYDTEGHIFRISKMGIEVTTIKHTQFESLILVLKKVCKELFIEPLDYLNLDINNSEDFLILSYLQTEGDLPIVFEPSDYFDLKVPMNEQVTTILKEHIRNVSNSVVVKTTRFNLNQLTERKTVKLSVLKQIIKNLNENSVDTLLEELQDSDKYIWNNVGKNLIKHLRR